MRGGGCDPVSEVASAMKSAKSFNCSSKKKGQLHLQIVKISVTQNIPHDSFFFCGGNSCFCRYHSIIIACNLTTNEHVLCSADFADLMKMTWVDCLAIVRLFSLQYHTLSSQQIVASFQVIKRDRWNETDQYRSRRQVHPTCLIPRYVITISTWKGQKCHEMTEAPICWVMVDAVDVYLHLRIPSILAPISQSYVQFQDFKV